MVSDSLCWRCANACGQCEWSATYTPVPGWDAVPTRKYSQSDKSRRPYLDSYHVKACPKFADDGTDVTKGAEA